MNNKLKTEWNLNLVFKGIDDPLIDKLRIQAEIDSNKFVKKWKTDKKFLKDPKKLKNALDEYEAFFRNLGFASAEWYYFSLLFSKNQNNPEIKAKLNKVEIFGKNILNKMQFFEIEISKIDAKFQDKFLKSPELKDYKHFLEKLFRAGKYTLSENEEKIMTLKSATSHDNWEKMIQGIISKQERKVLDEKNNIVIKNFSEILSLINSKDKKVRDKAASALNDILNENIDIAENEINSVLQNKHINDQIRGYERPDVSRHVSDDIDTQVVDALVEEVSKNFQIARNYYELKAKLFGVDKLEYHERNVEYGSINTKYSYSQAVKMLQTVFGKMDESIKSIFDKFVTEGRIDVYPQKGKRSGAFCTYGLLEHPTYALLNWTGRLEDVLTFAHEMGHGINFEMIKSHQNSLNYGTTVATTEVASTFMEDFVLQHLLNEAEDELKLSLIMNKLNSDISTIFRQIAFYNFEKELHEKFRQTGYLSAEAIGSIFRKHMESYMGKYVKQSSGSQNWWVYVWHFRSFFYVYSYASGLLISKSLQRKYMSNHSFIKVIISFFSVGLSEAPHDTFLKLGVNISDPKFWENGLSEIKDLLTEAETLSRKLGKI